MENETKLACVPHCFGSTCSSKEKKKRKAS